jgi:mono/diheme cytochrome c family protein
LSDQRTGRELTPRPDDEPRAVTPRESALPASQDAATERFYAGDQAHSVGLTEERAGQVVRQSSNARMVAFLGSLFLVLFVPLYWLYDIGIPALGMGGRLQAEAETQYVTSVARGHALYLANCAQCHGDNGQGGIGPPLNDQMKLYNTVNEAGLPGPGHLNPTYLQTVLEEGGRYVCGDPNSIMPAWQQPKGPLNYREIEEIIAFLLASDEVTWQELGAGHGAEASVSPGAPGAHGESESEAEEHRGWRDPDFSPPPDATPVPECWRGGPGNGNGGSPSPQPVESPGTAESPRVVEVLGTNQIRWVDPSSGEAYESLTVVEGEVIEFRVGNESPDVPHSFYIGSAEELEQAPAETDLPGIDPFTSEDGTQTFVWTVENLPENPQFACTVPGHYPTMNVDLILTTQPGTSPGASPGASPGTSPGASPGESPAASPGGSPAASPTGSP